MASTHALDRIKERCEGLDLEAALRRCEAKFPLGDVAVRVAVLPENRGDTAGDFYDRASNGNEVWFVVRGGLVVTAMLRRSAQPKTKAAFNVRAVVLALN